MSLLTEENKLMEIVKLIGSDVLPEDQKLVIEICKVIRVGYLQQNAFHQDDTYVPLEKQQKMMETILYLYHSCSDALRNGYALSSILSTGIFDTVTKMKYDVPNDHLEYFEGYAQKIDEAVRRGTE